MKNICIMVLMLAAMTGCATWQPPEEDKLRALPLVRFGETIPVGTDYILYFPAGQPIPIQVLIDGNVFERGAQDTLNVALRRDIYAYKAWVSYDQKSWIRGKDAFTFKVGIKLPGYDNPKPGTVEIRMDAK